MHRRCAHAPLVAPAVASAARAASRAPDGAAPGAHALRMALRTPAPGGVALRLGAPGDAAEAEADRAAAAVGTESAAPSTGTVPEGAPAARPLAGVFGAGAALPDGVRAALEPRLGRGLGHVRVHTGAAAQRAAGGLGVRAFAAGSDVAFGAGEYRPHTPDGLRLLAHEAAHTLQPSAGETLRAKFVATGDPAGFASLANGILAPYHVVAVDANGVVAIKAGTVPPNTPKEGPGSSTLAGIIGRLIGAAKTASIAFEHGQKAGQAPGIRIDGFDSSIVDLDDIAALKTTQIGVNPAAALVHALQEQFEKQVNGVATRGPAHLRAIQEEEKALGPGVRRVSTEVQSVPGPDASGNLPPDRTDFAVYAYPDGKRVTVAMHIKNHNIISTSRTIY
jgi:hypothetical protein